MAIETNEADDEMKIVIKSKLARRVLSSVIENAINKNLESNLDLKVNIKDLVASSSRDGKIVFALAVDGTVDKDKIFRLIGHKGGLS